MEKKKRNGFLDIVKTVATILILFHHFQQNVSVRFSVINFWNGTFYFGLLVELFFVISGFLMTPYITKIKEGLSFKSFFVRRYLRLIPIVAISTVMDLIFKSLLYYELFMEDPLKIILETLSVALGVHSILTSGITYANNPMWYVGALLWCYISFYIVFSICKRLKDKNYILCCLSSVIMILVGFNMLLLNYDLPFFNAYLGRGLASFFCGVLVGVLVRRLSLSNKLMVPILIFTLVAYYYLMSHGSSSLLFIIGCCYVPLLILSRSSLLVKIFDHSFWPLMANISFHAFCFHIPILALLKILFSTDSLRESVYANGLLSMIIYVVIVYGVSLMTYFGIEKPLAKKIRKLSLS